MDPGSQSFNGLALIKINPLTPQNISNEFYFEIKSHLDIFLNTYKRNKKLLDEIITKIMILNLDLFFSILSYMI